MGASHGRGRVSEWALLTTSDARGTTGRSVRTIGTDRPVYLDARIVIQYIRIRVCTSCRLGHERCRSCGRVLIPCSGLCSGLAWLRAEAPENGDM